MTRCDACRERPDNNAPIAANIALSTLCLPSLSLSVVSVSVSRLCLYLSRLAQPAKGVQAFNTKPGQYLVANVS